MAAVLFGAAGTLAVPMSWAYLALFAVLYAGATAVIYLQSLDLVKRPGEGEQDRVIVRTLNLLMFFKFFVVIRQSPLPLPLRQAQARYAGPIS
jgi:hypothetical protein